MLENFTLFLISVISNLFSAFSGGGAGVIQLPAILLLFELSFIKALASHKIATVALGIGASLRFLKEKKINKNFFVGSLIIGIPGVILGANFISYIDDYHAKISLGLLIILISIYSYIKREHGLYTEKSNLSINKFIFSWIIIFIIGFINGSLSAGTGLLFTIWLVMWHKMSYKEAIIYTLVIVGFFYNLCGAITLATYTNVYWDILPSLIIGSLIGGYLGAHISLSKDNNTIRTIYQIVTMIVGLKLIYG